MADIVMKAVDWLNTNSGAIIAIGTVAVAAATVVLVGVTIFYAWVTKKMLDDNRQMRIDTQKPVIAVYAAVYDNPFRCVGLVLENTGVGAAWEVRFTLDRSVKIGHNRTLESVRFLDGLDCIPPKYERRVSLCESTDDEYQKLMEKQLAIKVTYKDSIGNGYKHCRSISFNKSVRLKAAVG